MYGKASQGSSSVGVPSVSYTHLAAEVIIPELIARGYQLVTVSELAQYRGGMSGGHVYTRFRP